MHKTASKNHHARHHSNHALSDDLAKLKAALADTTFDLKGKAAQTFYNSYDSLRENTESLKNNSADYIARKPFTTIGGAILLGVVFGFLLRR